MAKFIRYALAAVCFAASVGCLALWWRSYTHDDWLSGNFTSNGFMQARTCCGRCEVSFHSNVKLDYKQWRYRRGSVSSTLRELKTGHTRFKVAHLVLPYRHDYSCYFPLWYPALIFAIAAVASLRIGRFTLRSAIIAMTVMAGLLGMAVGL